MSYNTILNEASSEFEEKKSIFIGHAKRVNTEEEAKQFISDIKSKHREAKHNVYAYVIGENLGIQRYNDDGEPQGTGGIPILQAIKNIGVTDIVVVVTRYFGGILLGTGGLIRAYSKGASLAIKEGNIVQKVIGKSINITIEYDHLGKIQYIFGQNNWYIENIIYTDKVIIFTNCEVYNLDKVKKAVIEATSSKCIIEEKNEKMYFKLENRLVE